MAETDWINRDLFEQAVLPLFEENRADWLADARAVALSLGEAQTEVSIDDVRKRLPPPMGQDPRVMGAVFERKYWTRVRVERSARRRCHNRPITIWQLKKEPEKH